MKYMLISQILRKQCINQDLQVIAHQCSDFLKESHDLPLFKYLSNQYSDIQKVKARKRNIKTPIAETLSEAFSDEFSNLSQRAIYTYGQLIETTDKNLDPFYIFPINGYDYLFSTEVTNSSNNFKQVINMVFEQFGIEKGKQIITDLIKFSYTSSNLTEGISKGAEIMFYNIPFYYAVRVTSTDTYNTLLTAISNNK